MTRQLVVSESHLPPRLTAVLRGSHMVRSCSRSSPPFTTVGSWKICSNSTEDANLSGNIVESCDKWTDYDILLCHDVSCDELRASRSYVLIG